MVVDKLQFWYKSSDKEPGKGSGEHINKKDEYLYLIKIKNWRKKLSNEYPVNFILSDIKWDSVDDFCDGRDESM